MQKARDLSVRAFWKQVQFFLETVLMNVDVHKHIGASSMPGNPAVHRTLCRDKLITVKVRREVSRTDDKWNFTDHLVFCVPTDEVRRPCRPFAFQFIGNDFYGQARNIRRRQQNIVAFRHHERGGEYYFITINV